MWWRSVHPVLMAAAGLFIWATWAPSTLTLWQQASATRRAALVFWGVTAWLWWRLACAAARSVRRLRTPTTEGFRAKVVGREPERSPEDLARFARHEAAHAVVARAMGGEVPLVTVERLDAHVGGRTTSLWPEQWPLWDQAWAALVTAIAGNVADVAAGDHDGVASSDMDRVGGLIPVIMSTGCQPSGSSGDLSWDGLIGGARVVAGEILALNVEACSRLSELLVHTRGRHPVDPAAWQCLPIQPALWPSRQDGLAGVCCPVPAGR